MEYGNASEKRWVSSRVSARAEKNDWYWFHLEIYDFDYNAEGEPMTHGRAWPVGFQLVPLEEMEPHFKGEDFIWE